MVVDAKEIRCGLGEISQIHHFTGKIADLLGVGRGELKLAKGPDKNVRFYLVSSDREVEGISLIPASMVSNLDVPSLLKTKPTENKSTKKQITTAVFIAENLSS